DELRQARQRARAEAFVRVRTCCSVYWGFRSSNLAEKRAGGQRPFTTPVSCGRSGPNPSTNLLSEPDDQLDWRQPNRGQATSFNAHIATESGVQAFDYVITLMSFVYALAIAHILATAGDIIGAWSRVKFSWLNAAWMLFQLFAILAW